MNKNKVVNMNGETVVGRKCVMCKHVAVERFTPFCSKRCADLDLGKWLNGSYIVAENNQNEESDYSSNSTAEIDSIDQ